jgi:hypothetical protein
MSRSSQNVLSMTLVSSDETYSSLIMLDIVIDNLNRLAQLVMKHFGHRSVFLVVIDIVCCLPHLYVLTASGPT